MLQVGPAGHDRIAMCTRQLDERRFNTLQVRLDDPERVADLKHGGRVHDVLGRRPPVHVAAGLAALERHLVHETDDGIANDVGLRLQLGNVDCFGSRKRADALSRCSRHDPD
jgi:hypothetical protein